MNTIYCMYVSVSENQGYGESVRSLGRGPGLAVFRIRIRIRIRMDPH